MISTRGRYALRVLVDLAEHGLAAALDDEVGYHVGVRHLFLALLLHPVGEAGEALALEEERHGEVEVGGPYLRYDLPVEGILHFL